MSEIVSFFPLKLPYHNSAQFLIFLVKTSNIIEETFRIVCHNMHFSGDFIA